MNDMYKQIVESYFNNMNCENHWYVSGSDKIVITYFDDVYCDIYSDARDCFESYMKGNIEDWFDARDLYLFDEEELDFIKEQYPGSKIANMIEQAEKERV